MDLIDQIRGLSAQANKLRGADLLKTEEGTKNALVMPFIRALGYDVFDPTEVTPELIADVGTKKGEKVDYAILKDGKPILLFECKMFGTNLGDVQASQLFRYFSTTEARFGVLTDGVVYQFFTDLEAQNKMDTKPFFAFNLFDFNDDSVAELKKFTKAQFDTLNIKATASELKYKREIKRYLAYQLEEPSDDFVRLLLEGSGAYTGRYSQAILAQFREVARDAFEQFIKEQIESKFKSFMARETKPAEASAPDTTTQEQSQLDSLARGVVTTEDERDAFLIIRAILREVVDVHRIVMRDQKSYCSVLLDDNNRKPIVRLHLDSTKKSVSFFDAEKNEERVPIESVDDLYKLADRLKACVLVYES